MAHYAFVNPKVAEQYTGARERILQQWQRPQPLTPGWTLALTIWVPGGHLTEDPDAKAGGKDVVWVPPPGAGERLGMQVWMVASDAPNLDLRAGDGATYTMRGGFTLSSGERLVVISLVAPMTEDLWRRLQEADQEFEPADMEDTSPEEGWRRATFVSFPNKDGVEQRQVWDLGLEPLR